jgi:hypothetical protein
MMTIANYFSGRLFYVSIREKLERPAFKPKEMFMHFRGYFKLGPPTPFEDLTRFLDPGYIPENIYS